MDTRQLKAFVALAERLNFSRAAESLYITQPALSQQIAELEKNLGCKLFFRDRRSVALTESGAAILPHVRTILETAERLPRIAQALAEQPLAPNRLTVGVDEKLMRTGEAAYALSKVSRRFYRERPSVELDIRELAYNEVEPALKKGELDVGISMKYEIEERSDVNCIALSHDTLVMLCAREDVLPGDIKTILSNSEVLLLTNNPHEQMHMVRIFSDLGVFPRFRLEASESIILMKVYSGEGVMLLPKAAAQGYLDEHLIIRSVDVDIASLYSVLIWPKNNTNPAISLFCDMLLEQYDMAEDI